MYFCIKPQLQIRTVPKTLLDLARKMRFDVSPLSRLSALQCLDLAGTLVSDLSPLSGLAKLESVWVESEARRKVLGRTLGKRGGIVKVIRGRDDVGTAAAAVRQMGAKKAEHPRRAVRRPTKV